MIDLEIKRFEKYRLAQEAIKDILYMYRTLVDYSGLFDDFGTEDGIFDPAIYIDCPFETMDLTDSDASLLHEGSAIKLICRVKQAWGQHGYDAKHDTSWTLTARTLLSHGRLKHIPELEVVLQKFLESYEEGNEYAYNLDIYKKYVLGYFEKLSRGFL